MQLSRFLPALLLASVAQAQMIAPIDPFVGDHFEGFETQHTIVGGGHPPTHAPCVVGGLFGGGATMCAIDPPFLVSVNGSTVAGGCTLVHRTGDFHAAALFTGVKLSFNSDLEQFGGYFASPSSTAPGFGVFDVKFLDDLNMPLGTVQCVLTQNCGEYEWHGWRVPGGRIRSIEFQSVTPSVTLYMDDLMISAAPTFGRVYCQVNETSLEERAYCSASGTNAFAANNVTLNASQLPFNTFGFFLASRTSSFVPLAGGGAGNLCLGTEIGRFVGPGQILGSGNAGHFSLPIDLLSLPTPSGSVAAQAGQTWHFQAWFRDVDSTPLMNPTSNFTSGYRVRFL